MIQSLFQNPILLAAATAAWVPFLTFAVIMILTRPYPRFSATLSIATVAISFFNALYLIMHHGPPNQPIYFTARWLVSGTTSIHFGLLLDPTSLLMLLIVAGISFLVQVYSLGYMSGDPGFSRYYAFQSLFAGSMMSLVLSSSLIQLYFFWELVGLCSYLLIGFWIEKFSATEAGKKAFVMTRLGDVAFFLGLLVVLLNLGNVNILEMNGPEATRPFIFRVDHSFGSFDFWGNCRQKCSVSSSDLASRCHGRAHTGQCLAPFGYHGGRRDFPLRPSLSFFQSFRIGYDRFSGYRHLDHADGLHHGPGGSGYQENLGLFHDQSIRVS